ncbi:MAG: hypothetical protein WCO78_04245 [Candidatus Roizmanbacteria bacterium]
MTIVLNGPINSGKTTVGKILSEKIPNLSHIEVDRIREFISWMDNVTAWDISFSTALLVAKEFLNRGIHVLITYPISDKRYLQIVDKLKSASTITHAFTLLPPLNITITNRGTRALNAWEIQRIKDTYEKNTYAVTFGETIDNSHQRPQETAEYIFNSIQKSINT